MGLDVEHVARGLRGDDVSAERLAELRDVVLECVLRRRRRLARPELLDQRIGRDDLVAVEHEQRQQGPVHLAREGNRLAVADDLERTEDTELQHVRVVTPLPGDS